MGEIQIERAYEWIDGQYLKQGTDVSTVIVVQHTLEG